MSTLVLIRHGQASLRAANYDVLSELGIEQSRHLGDYLGRHGIGFDIIAMGPLQRHRDTALHLVAAARERAHVLPEPLVAPEFDEFPALEIMRRALPDLAAHDPAIAALQTALAGTASGDSKAFRRAFEPLFQELMRRWIDGAFDHIVEPYGDFQARVEAGTLRLLSEAKRGARIAVVTSAGPIGAALRLAQGLTPWNAMRATFVVKNASLSDFMHRPGELTLSRFNGVPHLDEPRLISLR